MFWLTDYVLAYRLCVGLQIMCWLTDYVLAYRLCVGLQIMCWLTDYVLAYRLCVCLELNLLNPLCGVTHMCRQKVRVTDKTGGRNKREVCGAREARF